MSPGVGAKEDTVSNPQLPGEGKALVTGSVWGQKYESQMPCWGVCQAVPLSAKQKLPEAGKSMGNAGCGHLCRGEPVHVVLDTDPTGFPFPVCFSRPFVWFPDS